MLHTIVLGITLLNTTFAAVRFVTMSSTSGASSIQYFDLPDGQGCRMAYRTFSPSTPEAQSRTPLFLINGLSAVMEDWSPLFEALGSTRPVVISDHRAIGHSTVSPDWDQQLTLETMGLDVIHLAHHLHYRIIDLLGFSMGGHITQAILSSPTLATIASDGSVLIADKVKVRKAILSATMTKLPRGDINLNQLNAQAQEIEDKNKRNEFITYHMMRAQYHDDVLGPTGALQRQFQHRLECVRNTLRPAWVIALQFMAIQSADLRNQLARIPSTLPILVIHGHKDRMVLYSESNIILDKIPHAKRLHSPNPDFAHFWYDYFSIDFWSTSIANFLDNTTLESPHSAAKL